MRIFEGSRIRPIARKLLHAARRARSYPMLHIGQFGSSRPLSRASGYDRGSPVDRYYIEAFLADHASDIHGRVLEVGEDMYSRRFGGDRISRQDILHVDRSNPKATIVGDLVSPGLLKPQCFDCIIMTQTLQYVFDIAAALKQVRAALRPGGVLLLTVPGIAPIGNDPWGDSFYWRFTRQSVERLLAEAFDPSSLEVRPFGNLYAATLFLHGAATEEASKRKLQTSMPGYEIVIGARAVA